MKKFGFRTLFLISIFTSVNWTHAEDSGKGIGPVDSVEMGALNPALANKGKGIFQAKCSACHKMDERYVGPALKGITARRRPEWIMNMILNPQEMTQKDPTAVKLLEEYLTQMAAVEMTKDDARAILEHLRDYDNGGAKAGGEKAVKKVKAKK